MSVVDVLPVALAFNPNFVAFKAKFDDVIEEIEIDAGDYEFRRSKKEQYQKRHRRYGFLKLDLLNYIKRFQSKYNWEDKEIIYKGRVYKDVYLRRLNDKVMSYYPSVKQGSYCNRNGRMVLADPNAKKYFINKYNIKNKENQITELSPEMDEQFITKFIYDYREYGGGFRFEEWRKEVSEKYNEEAGFVVKVRMVYKTLDYNGLMRRYWSPSNLKYWDKNNMKTSNRGLKADTTWSYSNKDYRGGWTFGGITANDIENFCVRNGFKKEKGKKYQYGDYANWFLHILE
jgi:hypothetical protein